MISWWILIIGFAVAGIRAQAEEAARFQSMDQYTRIQIPAATGSTFRLINGNGGEATVVLDRVRPGSLGAATGWSDSRVKAVSVSSLSLDKVEIRVQFQDKNTEAFAYLQGGTLVLDLWRQAPAKHDAAAATKVAAAKPGKKTAAPAKTRKLASVNEEKPVANVEPLRREKDLFQRFVLPMPELRVDAAGGGFDLPPKGEIDGLWKFSRGDKETDEGKSFEFAKKLFQDKKYGLALKTIEIVRRDQPKSPYLEEIAFLEALAYRKLGESTKTDALTEKSERLFEELAAKRDEKGAALPFAPAIQLYFGQKEYNKKNWLQMIQHLEAAASALAADDPSLPYLQIMLAEAYGEVNQPRRAERMYRYLFERFPKHVIAKESRYRIADLLAVERNYNRVTEEGQAAVTAYPEYEKIRSEVLFQIGEANFWLGNYSRAEKYLRRYTEISSAHTNAALAWVRLGEIAEVTKGDLKAARAAYMKAKNGYPFSQGDLVATVRLARIDLPVEKEPGFIVKTLNEMLADKTMDADLRRMAELTLADYLLLTGEVDKSITLARAGMAQTDGNAYEAYKKAYTKGLFTKLESLNHQKNFSAALKLYDDEKKWFEEYGAESLRAASDTYRGLGLYATSNELMEKYGKEKRGRGLASGVLSLAQAKNSFARGAYAEALQGLPEDGEPALMAMRAVAEFRIGQKRKAYGSAEKALAASEKGTLPDATLGELNEILLDRSMTERDFPRMQKDTARVAALMEKEDERVTYAAADSLWYQKKHEEAAKAYTDALEKFAKGERADRARYNLGMSYVTLGKKAEAVKLLTALRDSGQGIWAESARQELDLMEWEKKYSTVLRTLPPSGLGIEN